MNENCLCVLVVTKTAKVSVSVSGVGLGLDHAGLGLGLGLGLSGLDNISDAKPQRSARLCRAFSVSTARSDLLNLRRVGRHFTCMLGAFNRLHCRVTLSRYTA